MPKARSGLWATTTTSGSYTRPSSSSTGNREATMSGNMTLIRRVLFAGSVVAAGLGAWEKAINFMGYTMLAGYPASRLLDGASVGLLFVIALELRDIRHLQ